ncbi:MAG: sulfotransferase [Vicinamibacterales bacterium]
MSSPPPYSFVERLLHTLAFSTPSVQLGAADVERAMHGRRFEHLPVSRPIFVTSLPRAGTTLLLERLAAHPDLAAHCYRDMPFVLSPLLWAQLSGPFRVDHARAERAHGDGVQVNVDSPEAFEEVAWMAFWPEKYGPDEIRLWAETDHADDFPAFMKALVQRVIAVRSTPDHPRSRYVSKNNANVARRRLLSRLFPDAAIVVPFREPVAQAMSLLTQHRRFLDLHREHDFTRRYMRDIGHFEFGALHRPIAFDGVTDMRARYSTDTLDYWLAYWVHGFRHVLSEGDGVVFVSYERLCSGGAAALDSLTTSLGLTPRALDDDQSFWEPRGHRDRRSEVRDQNLLAAADAVHAELLSRSIV